MTSFRKGMGRGDERFHSCCNSRIRHNSYSNDMEGFIMTETIILIASIYTAIIATMVLREVMNRDR
jgi:hypothetical protein